MRIDYPEYLKPGKDFVIPKIGTTLFVCNQVDFGGWISGIATIVGATDAYILVDSAFSDIRQINIFDHRIISLTRK